MNKRKEFGDPLARRSAGLTTAPEIAVALVGDYEDDVAERLRAIKRREAKGVRLGWENGRDLVALRDALAGSFRAVLADEFPHWSRSSAYDFIAFYETFPDLSQIEGLSMTTVRLLIRGTTPPPARQRILESVRQGTPLTWKQAQAIVEAEQLALLPPVLSLEETIALVRRVLEERAGPGQEDAGDRLARLESLRAMRSYEPYLDKGARLDEEVFGAAWSAVQRELVGRVEQAAQSAANAGRATSEPTQSPDVQKAGPPTLPQDLVEKGWEVREIAPGVARWYGFRPQQGETPAKSTGTAADGATLAAAVRAVEGEAVGVRSGDVMEVGGKDVAVQDDAAVRRVHSYDDVRGGESVTLRLSPVAVAALLAWARDGPAVGLAADARQELVAAATAALAEKRA